MKSDIRGPKSESNPLVFVALGSNLGESRSILFRVTDRLQELTDHPVIRSSLWETAPLDCPPGSPPFINAVAGFVPHPGEVPERLLVKLQALETEFGREPKKVLNEPRPLDLDLIAFGSLVRRTEALVLPHPRAHLRRFVLAPLAEIAADLVLPGQERTVAQLLTALADDPSAKRLS